MAIEIPNPEQFSKLPEDVRKLLTSLTPENLIILNVTYEFEARDNMSNDPEKHAAVVYDAQSDIAWARFR